jgi:hypothetical protein
MSGQPVELGVKDIFDRLDAWRHFPGYALERRADIFFSLYLREVIAGELNVELAETIIPEFPLKHSHNNQSDKVDYLLCSTDCQSVFLVELKTDIASLRTPQAAYLERAKAAGLTVLLGDVCTIVRATDAVYKYHQLLRGLSTLGLLLLPVELQADALSASKREVRALLHKVDVQQLSRATVDIVYIQPLHQKQPNRIDFQTFARYVARHDDPISRRFAESLRRWQDPAGQLQIEQDLAKVRA